MTPMVLRRDLVAAVREAATYLRQAENADAVIKYAQTTDKVVLGAWQIGECRCPAEAVGIDRHEDDAQAFAGDLDFRLGIDCEDADVFDVVDASEGQQR